jgi:hypothetical protein
VQFAQAKSCWPMCAIRSHIPKETLELCRKTNVHQTRAGNALVGESNKEKPVRSVPAVYILVAWTP